MAGSHLHIIFAWNASRISMPVTLHLHYPRTQNDGTNEKAKIASKKKREKSEMSDTYTGGEALAQRLPFLHLYALSAHKAAVSLPIIAPSNKYFVKWR